MKRKSPSVKTISRKDPFIAGFILPVLMLAAFAPTLLFQAQGDGVFIGDAPITPTQNQETPDEKQVRMFAAFDNPSAISGTLIVNFTPNTTLEQANAILAPLNLRIQTTSNCVTPQEVGPGATTVNGTPSCFSEGWFESISAGVVLVPAGTEKETAKKLVATSGIVWVEPNYTASIAGDDAPIPTLYENSNDFKEIPIGTISDTPSSTILGIEPILLVVGVLLVGFGAFFVMKKK